MNSYIKKIIIQAISKKETILYSLRLNGIGSVYFNYQNITRDVDIIFNICFLRLLQNQTKMEFYQLVGHNYYWMTNNSLFF